MRIKPIKDFILMKLAVEEKTKVAGIELTIGRAKGAKEWDAQTLTGIAIEVGPDVRDVNVGDECVFRGDAGRWVDRDLVEESEGKTHRIMDESEVLAIVDRELSTMPQPVEAI